MTFDDYRDKIIAALATILIAGIGYISIIALNAASKEDVEVMINKYKDPSLTPAARTEVQIMINDAKQSTPYMQDKAWVSGNIQDLNARVFKLTSDVEKNRDMIDAHTKGLWDEIAKLRVEVEKMNMWRDLYQYQDAPKKKGGMIFPLNPEITQTMKILSMIENIRIRLHRRILTP